MSSIVVAAPIRPSARSGNDVTASRWAAHLSALGHEVTIVPIDEELDGPGPSDVGWLDGADLLVTLHARRSAGLIRWWRRQYDRRPLVVALTGTDLYGDLPDGPSAPAAVAGVETADALVVLQRAAVARLDSIRPTWVDKTFVVHQSIDPGVIPARCRPDDEFRVVVLAHLRDVKDPLLAGRAAQTLPASSCVRVHHAGRALDEHWARAAREHADTNPRYVWHRELGHAGAMDLLASAHVLACTSLAEGGANVVTEAVAAGVPVVGTRIDGNTGLLGDDHPGLVPVGDHVALGELLGRLESDPSVLADLQHRTDRLRPITDPTTERRALADVLTSVLPS